MSNFTEKNLFYFWGAAEHANVDDLTQNHGIKESSIPTFVYENNLFVILELNIFAVKKLKINKLVFCVK